MSSADAPAPPAPEQPRSFYDKVGAALPIALTAIATAFAGMSTTELSYAMYWRSAAAQDQAKANDQWTLAGFKRDRSLIVQTTADQLRAASGYSPLQAVPDPEFALMSEARTHRTSLLVPRSEKRPSETELLLIESDLLKVDDPKIAGILEAVREHRAEREVLMLARDVDRAKLDSLIADAEAAVAKSDRDWKPHQDQIDVIVGGQLAAAMNVNDGKEQAKAVRFANAALAAKYAVDAMRYRVEARHNQQIGYLYEIRVKTSNATSDRHRARSMNFFYAMLAGQVGATLASLSLARKQKSVLWAVAAVAGVIAVTFGAYVYLGM